MDYKTVVWDPEELLLHILTDEPWFLRKLPPIEGDWLHEALTPAEFHEEARRKLLQVLRSPDQLNYLAGEDAKSDLERLTDSLSRFVHWAVDTPIVADRAHCRVWLSRLDSFAEAMPGVLQYVLNNLNSQYQSWIERDIASRHLLLVPQAKRALATLRWFSEHFSHAAKSWEELLKRRFREWDMVCSAPELVNDPDVLSRLERSFLEERQRMAPPYRT